MINLLDEAKKAGIIKEGRRQGNNTRMVDLAVQLLLDGNSVLVVTPNSYESDSEKLRMSVELGDRVLSRVKREFKNKGTAVEIGRRDGVLITLFEK